MALLILRSCNGCVVRAFALALAGLLLISLLPTARGQGVAVFTPPHSDQGLELNGNGLYDFLRVTVNGDATTPGDFFLLVDLYDAGNVTRIGAQFLSRSLSGSFSLSVDFLGMDVRGSGIDGPYRLNLYLYDDTFAALDFNVHMTQAYMSTEFEGPGLAFAPPHADTGVDTDGDALHNILRVTASVNVSMDGTYRFMGSLSAGFTYITSASATRPLTAGLRTVNLDFPGSAVYSYGVDGPYDVSLYAYDSVTTLQDRGTHVTAGYRAAEFDPPPATFRPAHADSPIDSDGDGLYNLIAVDAALVVAEAGEYRVSAYLRQPANFSFLGFATNDTYLPAGNRFVRLEFTTMPLVSCACDGPYTVELSLGSGALSLDSDTYLTGPYQATDFDPAGARFLPPHSDRGVDRDIPPDGEFNVLEVDVTVNVTDAGTYAVVGNLRDLGNTTDLGQDVTIQPLGPGDHAIALNFSGGRIRQAAVDGPYYLGLEMLLLAGNFPPEIDSDGYVTQPYGNTEFDSVVNAALRGTVRDATTGLGLQTANVVAFNYRDEAMVSEYADATGAYDMALYEGPWTVLFDAFDHQSTILNITVAAPETYANLALGPQVPVRMVSNLTVAAWDSLGLSNDMVIAADNATGRMAVDWVIGDRDGFAERDEFDVYAIVLGIGVFPGTTYGSFQVDGTGFDLVRGSETLNFEVADVSVLSPDPIRATMAATYRASGSIGSGSGHVVQLNAQYESTFQDVVYNVRLPSGFAFTDHAASANVSVTGVGTALATVDPGPDPDPYDSTTSEWVTLDASTTAPPGVASVSASPDPANLGTPTVINAVVTGGVVSVSVEIRNPSGGIVGNFTMTESFGVYGYAYTPNALGTYSYTAWATNGTGSYASRSGQFTVTDQTPPSIYSSSVAPSPQELGGTVRFSAGVSDAVGAAAVHVEVKDSSGSTLANLTMAYNATSGLYEASRYETDLGTFSVTFWAEDAAGNVGSRSGSYVVRDSTVPVANAGPDQTVTQGTTVTFNGAGSSDNHRIASHAWMLTDGTAVTLTGVSPTRTFDNPGTFVVTLTVTDPSGNSDTDTVTIAVTAAAPGGPSGFLDWWILAILVLAVAGAGVGALFWRRRKIRAMPKWPEPTTAPEELPPQPPQP